MFDSIYFDCPECGREIEAQSKGGSCVLATYSLDSIPADVAEDANRHAPFLCECGKFWRLEYDVPDTVKMKVV